MNFLSILLIGLSTNLDNFCMAVLIGAQKKRIPFLTNIIISLLSGIVSLIASMAAAFLSFLSFAGVIGSALIIGMGVYTLYVGIFKCEEPGLDMETLSLRQTFVTGCALALNCLPVAFGAGAMGLSPLLVSAFIAAISIVLMEVGARVGYRIGKKIKARYVNAASGVLLILLGCVGLLG